MPHCILLLGLGIRLRATLVLTCAHAPAHRPGNGANGNAFTRVARDRADDRATRRPTCGPAHPFAATHGWARWLRRRRRDSGMIHARLQFGLRRTGALVLLLLCTLAFRWIDYRLHFRNSLAT